MNNTMKKLILVVAFLVFGFTAQILTTTPAHGLSMTSSQVYINNYSLTMDAGVTLDLDSESYWMNAYSEQNWQPVDNIYEDVNKELSLSLAGINGGAEASAIIGDSFLQSNAIAYGDSNLPGINMFAENYANYSVTGSGNVYFSADYVLIQEVHATSESDYIASDLGVGIGIGGTINNSPDFIYTPDIYDQLYDDSGIANISRITTGTLSVWNYVVDGSIITATTYAYAQSYAFSNDINPVPDPQPLPSLASA